MAIIKTITNEFEFAEWLKNSDSYSNNFSFEGANALQAYLEEYSDDNGDIEFDPIAWCSEWSEYDSIDDYNQEHGTEYTLSEEDDDSLQYTTSVINCDNGHIVVLDF